MGIKMKGVSLFANVGIAETYLKEHGINIVVANELLPQRAIFYSYSHDNADVIMGDTSQESSVYEKYKQDRSIFFNEKDYQVSDEHAVVCGDITNTDVYNTIVKTAIEKAGGDETDSGIDYLMATPPCQGMSVAGAGLRMEESDPRNTLIISALNMINKLKPKYFLIENVPTMLKHKILVNGKEVFIVNHVDNMVGDDYILNRVADADYQFEKNGRIETQRPGQVANASDFGTPQSRKRAFILGVRKDISKEKGDFVWTIPVDKQDEITVREAIGYLPGLEAGEDESHNYKWHKAKEHNARHIKWLKHTPTGKTAFDNKEDEYCPNKNLQVDNKKYVWKKQTYGNYILNKKVGKNQWEEIEVGLTELGGLFVTSDGSKIHLNKNDYFEKGNVSVSKSSSGYQYSKDGEQVFVRISGYSTTYKRMHWNKPAPTITMANGSVSSQNNVHPGNLVGDEYDNARVLTLREIIILTGLDPDTWKVPSNKEVASENMIRHVIGECIPPRLIESIVKEISE